jgi:hypothetical protein
MNMGEKIKKILKEILTKKKKISWIREIIVSEKKKI